MHHLHACRVFLVHRGAPVSSDCALLHVKLVVCVITSCRNSFFVEQGGVRDAFTVVVSSGVFNSLPLTGW